MAEQNENKPDYMRIFLGDYIKDVIGVLPPERDKANEGVGLGKA